MSTSSDDYKSAAASINVFLSPLTVSARQRRGAAEAAKDLVFKRMAVLTDSAVVPGVTTAFGWLLPGPTIRAYRPSDLRPALDWLREEIVFDVPSIEAEVSAMCATLTARAA